MVLDGVCRRVGSKGENAGMGEHARMFMLSLCVDVRAWSSCRFCSWRTAICSWCCLSAGSACFSRNAITSPCLKSLCSWFPSNCEQHVNNPAKSMLYPLNSSVILPRVCYVP